MTATNSIQPPTGLRVSEKLLRAYRALQDHIADRIADSHHLDHFDLYSDRTVERLESRIFRATNIFPWTPEPVVCWVHCWLHILSYGDAKTRPRYQSYYGRAPRPERRDSIDWARQYDDIERVIEMELDEADRDRALP